MIQKNAMKKHIPVFFFCVVLALLSVEAYNSKQFYAESEKLPDLTLKKMNGKIVSLRDYQGKKLFITVWATWCKGCCEMKPMIDNSKLQLKSIDSLVFIDISLDRNINDWKEYVKKAPSLGTQFITEENVKKVIKSFGSKGIPFCVSVDKNGKFHTSLGGKTRVIDVRNIIETTD